MWDKALVGRFIYVDSVFGTLIVRYNTEKFGFEYDEVNV
jgi:hypothetical protein